MALVRWYFYQIFSKAMSESSKFCFRLKYLVCIWISIAFLYNLGQKFDVLSKTCIFFGIEWVRRLPISASDRIGASFIFWDAWIDAPLYCTDLYFSTAAWNTIYRKNLQLCPRKSCSWLIHCWEFFFGNCAYSKNYVSTSRIVSSSVV